MLDTLIEGGTVIDGSGAAPFAADVGVRDGRIVAVGRITEGARERIHAQGAWLTPGFIDIHTHYDGQASWDETFSPSIHHGVTTLVMGNCGVGFAPLRRGEQDRLIRLMEGVEDIPGVALAEGVRFDWQSFPQYMDALDALPHSLDFLAQVPHDPVRMLVMGERALAQEAATDDDIAAMRTIVHEALRAGAAGFSTGRSDNHRTSRGEETPASEAGAAELSGIARAFEGLEHGVIQLVSDFDLLRGPERFDAEFDLVEVLARASGRPLSMTWLQRDPGGAQWLRIRERVERAVAAGLPLYLQAAARGIGVIMGLDASFHPFMGFPGYQEIAHLPLGERAQALREPQRKASILAQKSLRLAGDGTPLPPLVDILLAMIEQISARMFALNSRDGATPDYEPPVNTSFYARAKARGVTALEAIYDHLVARRRGEPDLLSDLQLQRRQSRRRAQHAPAPARAVRPGRRGRACRHDLRREFFHLHAHALGARPGRRGRFSLEQVVHMLSARNAQYLGLLDRGRIAIGQRADLNLIDPKRLSVGVPELVRDLPGGGKRFLQRGVGYLNTWVAGQCVQQSGVVTDSRPGRLVRVGR